MDKGLKMLNEPISYWLVTSTTKIHRDCVFWDIFVAVMYRPKMGIVKNWKFCVRPEIFSFFKTAQDYGKRLDDICQVMPAVEYSLSIWILQAHWFNQTATLRATSVTQTNLLVIKVLYKLAPMAKAILLWLMVLLAECTLPSPEIRGLNPTISWVSVYLLSCHLENEGKRCRKLPLAIQVEMM